MQDDSGNFNTSAESHGWRTSLVVLLLLFLAGLVFCTYKIWVDSARDKETISTIAKLSGLSGRLEPLSGEVVSGNEDTLLTLTTTVGEMQSLWEKLQDDTRLNTEFEIYRATWNDIRLTIDEMTNNTIKNSIANMKSVVGRLQRATLNIQTENNKIIDYLLESKASAAQVSIAQRQSFLIERILSKLERLVYDRETGADIFEQYRADVTSFNESAQALLKGDSQRGIPAFSRTTAIGGLSEISEQFNLVNETMEQMATASNNLLSARQAREQLLPNIQTISSILGQMTPKVETLSLVNFFIYCAIAAVVGILFCVVSIIFSIQRQARTTIAMTAEATQRNQEAILRLLDELADLADGDLTTTATVTEDFTGAIADSINFTIEQLRVLVERINTTAVKVSSAAQDTQQTALHLAEASDHQSKEIAGASAAINEMAVTIDQVSANASESASVAERSVSIAKKGAKVVQNTINGMDTIREQIQDTSKRIKRLGESSQEIGDIVSLINDIADQTNILALNAAIQASMAGEAGRGFAVVADEVQRLAERSAAATKQIETLVKTIQTDTNEAVISMEQTTSEVVNGAKLAQDAGVALEEIEGVSANLAELIQSISNAARQQASSAGRVSSTMNVIQEITSQTSAGTQASARSIGELTEMALDLRDSVAGFTLPDEYRESDDNMPSVNAKGDTDFPLLEDSDVDPEEAAMMLSEESDLEADDSNTDFTDLDFDKEKS